MKIVKGIFNVLGIFISIIFSLILMAMLLLTPMVSAVSSFLRADTLHKVIKEVDLSEFLSSVTGEDLPIEINGLDLRFAQDLMESELVEDILALYVDSIFATIEGDTSKIISEDTIKNVVDKHMMDLLPLIKSYVGTDFPLSDENLLTLADSFVESMIPGLLSKLPTLEELGLDSTIITVLQKLYNGTYFTYSLCATIIISLLIVLFRFPRFKGFMWLAVAYLFSSVLILILAFLTKTSDLLLLTTEELSGFDFIITPLLTVLSGKLFKSAGSVALLGIVFIIIFVIGRKLLSKKNATSPITSST